MAATDIMACGPTRRCDLLRTAHLAAFLVKPAQFVVDLEIVGLAVFLWHASRWPMFRFPMFLLTHNCKTILDIKRNLQQWWETHQSLSKECQLKALRCSRACSHMHILVLTHLLACHVWTPDLSSHGFYRPYQIALTLFDIIIEFIRVNGVDLYTFEGIQPNFRVGQLPIFVKSKVVLFMRFKQKYIIDKT